MCQKDLRGPLTETLEWISAQGFDGFQIWQRQIDTAGLRPSEVARIADELGLTVSAVGGGPNLVEPQNSTRAIEEFRGFLELSAELGCRIVTAESKAKPDDLPVQDAWASTAETVAAICDHAAEVGAVLAIECAAPCFIEHHHHWHQLADQVGSDRLKVNMDPANIAWSGRDPVEAVTSLADHIVHTHAKDIVFTDEGAANIGQPGVQDVPAGEGLVDYPHYLAELRTIGYDGFLTVEMHAGGGNNRERAAAAAQNLRSILETLPTQTS